VHVPDSEVRAGFKRDRRDLEGGDAPSYAPRQDAAPAQRLERMLGPGDRPREGSLGTRFIEGGVGLAVYVQDGGRVSPAGVPRPLELIDGSRFLPRCTVL